MPIAQSLGGKLTEQQAIIPGHAAKLPNPKLSCYRGDRFLGRISGLQCASYLMKSSSI